MRDNRKSPRKQSRLQGKAILSGRADVDCSIRDLNATGARLGFRYPTILPRIFNLRFGEEEQRVTVIWQAGIIAGVRFQKPTRAYVPEQKKRFAFFGGR